MHTGLAGIGLFADVDVVGRVAKSLRVKSACVLQAAQAFYVR